MSSIEVSQKNASARSKKSMLLALAALVVVAAVFAAWRVLEKPSLTKYEPVIAMLQSHQLIADAQGHVDLAKKFPGLTPHDQVYITLRDDGWLLVLFPTYYGQGTEIAGLLYTSRPLQPEDTHRREMSAIHFDQHLISVADYANLLLEERINEHWYHVSYRLN